MDLGRWSQDDDRVRDIYLEEEGEGERGDHLELEWKLVSAACHCGAVGIHCVTDWALRWLGWRGVEIRRRRGEDGLGITGQMLRRWLMDASTLVGMLFVLKLSGEKEGFEGKFLLWLKSNDTPSAMKNNPMGSSYRKRKLSKSHLVLLSLQMLQVHAILHICSYPLAITDHDY